MKACLFLLGLLALIPQSVGAQTPACHSVLDTPTVVRIAKKHNAYWTENWVYAPTLQFDSTKCTWSVSSGKSRYTKKGKCKYTNGCTETTTVVIIIDAKTKKVKSRKTEKSLIHNYE